MYSQAQNIVVNKRGDTKEACVSQFMHLESFIECMKLADPEGSYYIQSCPCSYLSTGQEFVRLYIAWGATKNFWKHSRYLCVYDIVYACLRMVVWSGRLVVWSSGRLVFSILFFLSFFLL